MDEFKRSLISLRTLTAASMKMYFRNRSAVFFTLFIPVLLILIFGVLNNSSGSKINLDLINKSDSALAKQYIEAVKKVELFKINETTDADAAERLSKGKSDLEVVIPAEFGQADATGKPQTSQVLTYFNQGRPGNGQSASLILSQLTNSINNNITQAPQLLTVESHGVKTNDLTQIDYLIPGIIAMSIMQLGIFSVAFAFISYKTTGALRRLQATPTRPINFLLAQSVARVVIGVLQVVVLLVLGMKVFHLHLLGNIFSFLTVTMFGTIVFLAFGFAIAGWAKDEMQAAPVANLMTFPMLFFSGVFFPRDGFPAWLHTISNYLPLTYLADALHRIANEGVSLWTVRGDLFALAIWGVVMYAVTVKIFRWE
jgi:ABC-2 type transport system permease protein